MEPIFETSIAFEKVIVYPDRIVYRTGLLKKETTILVSQIASVETGGMSGKIRIESTGGKTMKIIVRPGDRQELIDIIEKIRSRA